MKTLLLMRSPHSVVDEDMVYGIVTTDLCKPNRNLNNSPKTVLDDNITLERCNPVTRCRQIPYSDAQDVTDLWREQSLGVRTAKLLWE